MTASERFDQGAAKGLSRLVGGVADIQCSMQRRHSIGRTPHTLEVMQELDIRGETARGGVGGSCSLGNTQREGGYALGTQGGCAPLIESIPWTAPHPDIQTLDQLSPLEAAIAYGVQHHVERNPKFAVP